MAAVRRTHYILRRSFTRRRGKCSRRGTAGVRVLVLCVGAIGAAERREAIRGFTTGYYGATVTRSIGLIGRGMTPIHQPERLEHGRNTVPRPFSRFFGGRRLSFRVGKVKSRPDCWPRSATSVLGLSSYRLGLAVATQLRRLLLCSRESGEHPPSPKTAPLPRLLTLVL